MVPRCAPPEMAESSSALPKDEQQLAVPCLFMRGGSSRGGFFLEKDLPSDPIERNAVLLACYGSPDERQIDGIGGADPLTSKAAVVGPSTNDGADVNYTFCQVGIGDARVSTGGNCGNMLAAVGPFALLRGLVRATEPETRIRIYTTNTRQVVTALVPVSHNGPKWDGDCRIAGVPGAGAAIQLDFGNCAGAVSGKLLPTGAPFDVIRVDGRDVRVSLIDAATPFVFVRADDVGATGTELPEEIRADEGLMRRLEDIRGWAAMMLGLVQNPGLARSKSPNVPRVMMVASPATYTSTTAVEIAADSLDVIARQLAMQRPHRALAVTGAVCIAVAAAVPNSVVAGCAGSKKVVLRVGHPSGVMSVSSKVFENERKELQVESAVVERTARLIMAGMVYARPSAVADLVTSHRRET